MEREYFLTLYFNHSLIKSNLCSVITWSKVKIKYTCVYIYIYIYKSYCHPLQMILALTLLLLKKVLHP